MPIELTPREAIIQLNRIRTDKGERPPEIDMAIRTINRVFVKRKPVANEEGGVECPFCGESVDYYIYLDKYCSNCGQALDWREGKQSHGIFRFVHLSSFKTNSANV